MARSPERHGRRGSRSRSRSPGGRRRRSSERKRRVSRSRSGSGERRRRRRSRSRSRSSSAERRRDRRRGDERGRHQRRRRRRSSPSSSSDGSGERRADDWIQKAFQRWKSDGSDLRCALCPFFAFFRQNFFLHVEGRHHMEEDEYENTYGSPRTKWDVFTCNLCRAAMPFDQEKLLDHFEQTHRGKPNLYEYFKEHVFDLSCQTLAPPPPPTLDAVPEPPQEHLEFIRPPELEDMLRAARADRTADSIADMNATKDVDSSPSPKEDLSSKTSADDGFLRILPLTSMLPAEPEEPPPMKSFFWHEPFTEPGADPEQGASNEGVAAKRSRPEDEDSGQGAAPAAKKKRVEIVKELEDRCTFQCDACSDSFSSWRLLIVHCKQQHKFSPQDMLTEGKAKPTRWVKEAKYHKCEECQEKGKTLALLCDISFMIKHLDTAHNKMTIDEYRKRCTKRLEEPEDGQGESEPAKSELIGNLCHFSCPQCSESSSKSIEMIRHMRSKHVGIPWEIADLISKKVTFSCPLTNCNAVIICDLGFIKKHVENKHSMSMGQFRVFIDQPTDDPELDADSLEPEPEVAKTQESTSSQQARPVEAEKQEKKEDKDADSSDEDHENRIENAKKQVIGNFCRFRCPRCNFKTKSSKEILDHAKKEHPHRGYTIRDLTSKKIQYECPVPNCFGYTMWDLNYIKKHVEKRHKMSMKEFRALIGQPEEKESTAKAKSLDPPEREDHSKAQEKPEEPKKPESVSSPAERPVQAQPQGAKCADDPKEDTTVAGSKHEAVRVEEKESAKEEGQSNRTEPETAQPEDGDSKIIGDFCKYSCPECQRTATSATDILNHVKRKHKDEHFELRELVSQKVTYDCPIPECYAVIFCDISRIKKHAEKKHGMSMEEFRKAVGQPEEVTPKENVEEASAKAESRTNGEDIVDREPKAPFVKEKVDHVRTSSHSFKIEEDVKASPRESDSRDSKRESDQTKNKSKEIGNLCRFRCSECQVKFSSSKDLTDHMKSFHPKVIYELPELVTRKVVFECPLSKCHKEIFCDLRVIRRHADKKHFVSMSRYRELIGQPSDSDRAVAPGSSSAKSSHHASKESKHSHHSPSKPKPKPAAPRPSSSQQEKKNDGSIADQWLDFISEPMPKSAEKAPVSHKIQKGCKFACRFCDKTFTDVVLIARHLKGHKIPDINYNDLKRIATKLTLYECPVCEDMLLCDTNSLFSHAFTEHRMNVYEYLEKAKQSSKGLFKDPTPPNPDLKVNQVFENLCRFECNHCQHETDSYGSMKTHLMSKHRKGPARTEYTVLHEELFECPMCLQTCWNDRFQISSHSTSTHGIGIKEFIEYTNAYLESKGSQSPVPKKKKKKEKTKEVEDRHVSKVKEAVKSKEVASASPARHSSDNESVKVKTSPEKTCTFVCPHCKKELASSNRLKSHLKEKHDGASVSREDLPRYAKKVFHFKCSLCSKTMLADRSKINDHAKDKHKMDMDKFKAEINKVLSGPADGGSRESSPKEKEPRRKESTKLDRPSSAASLFQPDAVITPKVVSKPKSVCSSNVSISQSKQNNNQSSNQSSRPSSKISSQNKVNMRQGNPTSRAPEQLSPAVRSLVESEPVRPRKGNVSASLSLQTEIVSSVAGAVQAAADSIMVISLPPVQQLRASAVITELGNRCKYECSECHKSFTIGGAVVRHFRKRHYQGSDGDDINPDRFLRERVDHKCLSCGQVMKCEDSVILNHAKDVHECSREEYCNMQSVYKTIAN